MKTPLHIDIILKGGLDIQNDFKNNNVHEIIAIVIAIRDGWLHSSPVVAQVEELDSLSCSHNCDPHQRLEEGISSTCWTKAEPA